MTQVNFFTMAGHLHGFGHIIRTIALAQELVERDCICRFYGNDWAVERAVQGGFESRQFNPAMFAFPPCDVWVIDLEGGCPPRFAAEAKKTCRMLVLLSGVGYSDTDPGRLLADLVFYQGVTERPHQLDWTGFTGQWYEGIEWLILRKEFRDASVENWVHYYPRVIIAGGGADPKGVAKKAVAALPDYKVRVIVGPAGDAGEIEAVLDLRRLAMTDSEWADKTEVVYSPLDMAEALAWGDFAIVSFGMTAFECLALGIPTIALSVTPDHAASARLVQQASQGALCDLGVVERVRSHNIRCAVASALNNHEVLSQQARQFVDGKGAGRVADRILERLECSN